VSRRGPSDLRVCWEGVDISVPVYISMDSGGCRVLTLCGLLANHTTLSPGERADRSWKNRFLGL
jgi:hypothetical protein